MSRWTKFLDKPASVSADVTVSTLAGVAAFIVLSVALPVVPLIGWAASALSPSLAGVLAGMTYVRARKNLLDPEPAFKA